MQVSRYGREMAAVQEYLSSLDAPSRAAFERVMKIATKLVPEAQEGVSYGMAALLYRKKPLLGFRAAKGHLSIFPFSPGAIDAVRERLTGFEVSKGTVRFTADRLVPDDVVKDIVKHRRDQIAP
jgi:uncharacterized protein YdhG (YjbR/CyaY superfamily)